MGRKKGGVLTFSEEALAQAVEIKAGQRSPKGTVIGCCSCGATHPSRRRRGGDHGARRKRQCEQRERFREDQTLSNVLAVALNPSQGGSAPRNVERPAQLQQLQQFAVSGLKKGEQIQPSKGHLIFVGISTPTNRIDRTDEGRTEKAAGDDAAKRKKKGEAETGGENHQNKALRGIEDGLLLVITARINGHPVRGIDR